MTFQTDAKADADQGSASHAGQTAWSALGYTAFRYLWIATVVSNVGAWMYNAAAGWLMTSLNANPLIVSLVQVASSLPLFLFGLPAGALADMVDKRRFILLLEILTTIFSALFALLVTLHAVTPSVLLFFIFLVGYSATRAPLGQAIVPPPRPRKRFVGCRREQRGNQHQSCHRPCPAGIVILAFGIAAPLLDAVSNLGVIAVIFWWCPPAEASQTLPAEHLLNAVRTGVRYARDTRLYARR